MLPVKILFFSADIPLSQNVQECLSKEGYKLVHVSDGIGAINLIQVEKPMLIILDFYLPGFSSLAIIRSLRTQELSRRIPIIIIGAMREEDILIGLEAGADLCLVEDFHPQVFMARVRSIIRRSEPMRVL